MEGGDEEEAEAPTVYVCDRECCINYELPKNSAWLIKKIKGLLKSEGGNMRIDRLRGRIAHAVDTATSDANKHFMKMSLEELSCFLCKSKYFHISEDGVYLASGARPPCPNYISQVFQYENEKEGFEGTFPLDYTVTLPAYQNSPINVISTMEKARQAIAEIIYSSSKGAHKTLQDVLQCGLENRDRLRGWLPPSQVKEEENWDLDYDNDKKVEPEEVKVEVCEKRDEVVENRFFMPVVGVAIKSINLTNESQDNDTDTNKQVSIIQVCSMDKHVYLFDVLENSHLLDPVEEGGCELKELLECHYVMKVMYNSRDAASILFYSHAVVLRKIFDVMLADHLVEYESTENREYDYDTMCHDDASHYLSLNRLSHKYQVAIDFDNKRLSGTEVRMRPQLPAKNRRDRSRKFKEENTRKALGSFVANEGNDTSNYNAASNGTVDSNGFGVSGEMTQPSSSNVIVTDVWKCRPISEKYIVYAANEVLVMVPKMYCIIKNTMSKSLRYRFSEICKWTIYSKIKEDIINSIEDEKRRTQLLDLAGQHLHVWVKLPSYKAKESNSADQDNHSSQPEPRSSSIDSGLQSSCYSYHTTEGVGKMAGSQTDIVGDISTWDISMDEGGFDDQGNVSCQTTRTGEVLCHVTSQTDLSGHIVTASIAVLDLNAGECQTVLTGLVL